MCNIFSAVSQTTTDCWPQGMEEQLVTVLKIVTMRRDQAQPTSCIVLLNRIYALLFVFVFFSTDYNVTLFAFEMMEYVWRLMTFWRLWHLSIKLQFPECRIFAFYLCQTLSLSLLPQFFNFAIKWKFDDATFDRLQKARRVFPWL